MIVSSLKGGLANQIFQWACGKNLSIEYKVPLYLDISFYGNQEGCTPRKFSLEKFPNLDFKIFNQDRSFLIPIVEDSIFRSLQIERDKNYLLDGYWGSEKYFKNHEEEIKRNLSYNSNFIEKIENSRYKEVLNSNVTSIHIRRTDYLTSNGYHPVQPISYYERGLEIIGDYDFIYVFSDDIEWCKENINFERTVFVEGLEDVEDLWLMSLCKNNIIANSTFSWWAAWLNDCKNKVIAPKEWLSKEMNFITDSLYPEDWIRI